MGNQKGVVEKVGEDDEGEEKETTKKEMEDSRGKEGKCVCGQASDEWKVKEEEENEGEKKRGRYDQHKSWKAFYRWFFRWVV